MMTDVMANLSTAPRRQLPQRPAARRSPGERPSANRASRRPDRPRTPPVHPARRIVIGVLIGALTMLGVASLDRFADTTVPVLGTLAALPDPVATEARKLAEMPPPPAAPGTCLNWSRTDAADTRAVDCGTPHLFEQAGSVRLTDQATLPDDRGWRQLVNQRCTPIVVEYLGGKFDPDGRFRVGGLKPSPAKWAGGDREMRCGLQVASRSGALYPVVGKVAEQDQSAVQQPGTCLAIDGRTIGDPTPCAGPHAVETVGIVDLTQKFKDSFPAVGDQDNFLQAECTKIANDYAGGPDVISQKKLTVYWDNLTGDSWKAGTRRVNCNLAALLPDRSGFAPVTGSVKGPVSVGDSPAPPASNSPQPGAPASETPAPPAPTEPAAPTTAPSGEPSEPPAPATPASSGQQPAPQEPLPGPGTV
jgi:hypothetical protein